ncbi:MAG: exo-alpha-sialidase [Armatimonadetes bacterium]|nr:exo-alpha-sialidase [Armatimonadota bacterium]
MKQYSFGTCKLEIADPVVVGQAKGHFWFSTLHPFDDRNLLCEVVVTADMAQGKWPAKLYLSRDGGSSWNWVRDIDSYGPISTPLGPNRLLMMPYELWALSAKDKRNAQAEGTILTLSQEGSVAAETATVKFLDFPRDLADYHVGELYLLTNGNILRWRDGGLITTIYGRFAGEGKDCNIAMTSQDGGFTWRYHSLVAEGMTMQNAGEGANESNSVRLPDGRLMCVYRVGSSQPYCKSYSADEGATWTIPESMPGVFSVEPQLVRLGKGLILLSGGRPGLYLWVCADKEGKQWERINLAEHHNASLAEASSQYPASFCEGKDSSLSTSYTGMQKIGPNEALISYDRLTNSWSGAPGPWGKEDMVFTVRVKVEPR